MTQFPPPPGSKRSGVSGIATWARSHKLLSVIIALVVIGVISTLADGGQESGTGSTPTSTAAPSSATSVDVSKLPIFDGRDGGSVIALVNKDGLVSAKVLGDQPLDCMVTAGDEVKWSHDHYVDTGKLAADATGGAATSLMGTFTGPVGTGNESGWVFHADMNLVLPYPKAIVVSLDCSY